MKHRIAMRIISFVAMLFIRGLHATLRVRHAGVRNLDAAPQYILAFWHAHLLLMLHSRYRKPISAMISQSKDGEYIARVLDWYGAESARGSSTRGGGAALREMLQQVRDGKNIAFTPDGPKGPARVLKEGVIYAAQASGLPIIPVTFAAKEKRLLGSWDRMILPRPFTRALFVYGEPIVVPPEGDVEEWRQRIERVLNDHADDTEVNFDEIWRSGAR